MRQSKLFACRLVLLLLLFCSAAIGQEGQGGIKVHSLRCVTWNLQWFPGKSPASSKTNAEAHIKEVREALQRMNPDILILQEVAGEAVVEEALRGLEEMKVSVVSRFKRGGLIDGQQIAICSRLPARYVYSALWKNGWAGPPRGFAYAALASGPVTVHVVGLHLKSNLGDAEENAAKREDAVEQIFEHISKTDSEGDESKPVWIVAGDFNTDFQNSQTPSERSLKMFLENSFFWTFEGLPLKNRITCPAKGRYPDACFDHIFVKNLGRPVASPLKDIQGSDHLPVAFDFVLPDLPGDSGKKD